MNTPAAAPLITPDACPRLPRGVRLVHNEAQGGWVLLAPERVFKADPIAAEVVKRCTGEATLEAIVDDLAKTFGAPRERVFAEKTFHSYYDPMRAVRSPVAKLIVNFGVGFRVEVPADVTEGAIFRSDPGRYTGGPHPVAELYDLRADPLERHNLLEGDARPGPFEELRTALLAWMRDGDDPLLGARGPLIAPQHRRALHLLGA